MCNAWNHPPGCRCGWGGEWHQPSTPVTGRVTSRATDTRDFTRPTTCPKCHAQVFFVQYNGGKMWFDELGPPWLKHDCFTDAIEGTRLRTALRHRIQVSGISKAHHIDSQLCLVIEATKLTSSTNITLRLDDGRLVRREYRTARQPNNLVDRLAVLSRDGSGELRLSDLVVVGGGTPSAFAYSPAWLRETVLDRPRPTAPAPQRASLPPPTVAEAFSKHKPTYSQCPHCRVKVLYHRLAKHIRRQHPTVSQPAIPGKDCNAKQRKINNSNQSTAATLLPTGNSERRRNIKSVFMGEYRNPLAGPGCQINLYTICSLCGVLVKVKSMGWHTRHAHPWTVGND
jgi:hypothetical protein